MNSPPYSDPVRSSITEFIPHPRHVEVDEKALDKAASTLSEEEFPLERCQRPDSVVAICPTCHKPVHHAADGSEYNAELIEKLQTEIERVVTELERYVETHADTISARYYEGGENSFDTDTFAESLIRTARDHIKQFLRVIWPRFDGHHYITHETPHSFEVVSEPVTVQPDLCTRSPGDTFVVTDWKTSEYDRFGDPTVQMQAYGLYANEAYEPELGQILVQLVHIGTGETNRMIPTQKDVEHVRKRIKSDRSIWTSKGKIKSYETKQGAQKCKRCSYLERCAAGQDAANSLDASENVVGRQRNVGFDEDDPEGT